MALPHLPDSGARLHQEGRIGNHRAVALHGILLHHAETVGGRGHETGFSQEHSDLHGFPAIKTQRNLGNIIGNGIFGEPRHKISLGLVGVFGGMEPGNNLLGQLYLHIPGIYRPVLYAVLETLNFSNAGPAQEVVVVPHQIVADAHDLAEHVIGGIMNANIVSGALAHLLDAVQAHQKRHHHHHLRFHALLLLKLPPHKKVKALISAAHFHIRLKLHGIPGLQQRVDELMNGNGLPGLEALLEIVPLQHSGHGLPGGQLQHARGSQLAQPCRVVNNLCLFAIQNLEHLLGIGSGIFLDLFPGQGRTGGVLAGGISHGSGKVPDKENHLMSQILKGLQLIQNHCMSQMNVRSGRVHSQLYSEGTAQRELLSELLLRYYGFAAAG